MLTDRAPTSTHHDLDTPTPGTHGWWKVLCGVLLAAGLGAAAFVVWIVSQISGGLG